MTSFMSEEKKKSCKAWSATGPEITGAQRTDVLVCYCT